MTTAGTFARTLVRLRREAGFNTPYAYYQKNGGRHVFPFTFAYYLKLERGQHLPRPEWLPVLLSLLRIPPTDAMYRRFVLDYMKDLFATEENYQSLVAPLLREEPRAGAEQHARKRVIASDAYHVTVPQARALMADPAAYWCFECLTNDHGSFDAEELARVVGFPVAAVAKGLRTLTALKLAQKTSANRYKSRLAGRFYTFPMAFPGYEKERLRFNELADRMVRERGAVLHESGMMIRAEESAMRRAVSAFRGVLEDAAVYSIHDKVEGGGMFLLQTRVRKAFDF